MGVTVMIIMGLLSVLGISSIDFDQFDEIRARLKEACADQAEQEVTFEDTSELGWLDVPEGTDFGPLQDNVLTFATAGDAGAVAPSEEVGVNADIDDEDVDLFDDIFAEDTELDPELSADAAYGLWPFEDQSEDSDLAEQEAQDDELIELAAYDPTLEKVANDLAPEASVMHPIGASETNINEDALVQTASTDFKGLEPEDEQLQLAA